MVETIWAYQRPQMVKNDECLAHYRTQNKALCFRILMINLLG